jgi:putative methyltransferase (TIGR04325 family)
MIDLLKKLLRKNKYFSGPYKNWKIAETKSSGYDSDEIFNKVKASAEIVKNSEQGHERDSVISFKKEYDEFFLKILNKYSNEKNKIIKILDYGGSMGSLYFKYKNKIGSNFVWSIIEQKRYVDEGLKNFQNSTLDFFHNIEDYKGKHKADIILISSSLQYIENYTEIIFKLIDLKPSHVLILKTPFNYNKKDEIYIQKPLKHIYKSTYPCWIFSYDKFLKIMLKNYLLENSELTEPKMFTLQYLNLYFKNKNI